MIDKTKMLIKYCIYVKTMLKYCRVVLRREVKINMDDLIKDALNYAADNCKMSPKQQDELLDRILSDFLRKLYSNQGSA